MRITVNLSKETELKMTTDLMPAQGAGWVQCGDVIIELSMEDYMRLGYMINEQLVEKDRWDLVEKEQEKTGVQSEMEMATGEKSGEM